MTRVSENDISEKAAHLLDNISEKAAHLFDNSHDALASFTVASSASLKTARTFGRS